MVYSESLTGALYLDKPDELAAYETSGEGWMRWPSARQNRRT